MRYRLTITAAAAVVLASFSLFSVIQGAGWLWAGIGAAMVVAAAGLATRLPGAGAAVTATAAVLLAVMPLLVSGGWAGRIIALALIAAVAGSALTRRVLPVLADAGTYLAALLLYLNLCFAAGQSWAWIIPTARSMRHLGHLAQAGFAERIYAPPVPGIRGLEVVAAAGIGAVAILVDLIAVRLRSPAVAGLPLLVLFSVPVATNVKDTGLGLVLAFCFGVAGFLALLTADSRERLRLWGRLVTVWQDTPEDEDTRGPDTRALAASGRRIGLAAVVVAVVVPLALPAATANGLFGRNPAAGSGHGRGGVQVAAPQPLVTMRSQLNHPSAVPLLTYKTTAANPPQQYLQMYVLNYDAGSGTFTLPARGPSTPVGDGNLRSAPGIAPATAFSISKTTVTLARGSGSGRLSYLPVPYAPQSVADEGTGWVEDNATLMLYAFRSDTGLRYTATSKTAEPTQAQLSAGGRVPRAIKRGYLSYPGPDRAALQRIARGITKGARTHFQQAVMLEDYFTKPGRFAYQLNGKLPSTVLEFLTSNRRGFCQQFALAMAVLARLSGIPARVAVGYTAGAQIAPHTWQVTTADAHAWPELFFPGAGWLRFEPTPGGPEAQGTAVRPVYAGTTTGGQNSTGPQSGPSASAPAALGKGGTGGIRKQLPGEDAGAGLGAAGRLHSGGGFPFVPVIAALLVLLLAAPGLARLAVRQRRWAGASGDAARAHAAWQELATDLRDYGLEGTPSESPRALARRMAGISGLDPAASEAAGRITTAEERARYARAATPGGALRADARAARRGLTRNATGRERWRARLAPASVLRPAQAWLREATDVFGWLDAAGQRMRRTGRAQRAD